MSDPHDQPDTLELPPGSELRHEHSPGRSSDASPSAIRPAAIRLEALTRRFGGFVAVDGLSLEVPRGSLYGFLGPNGAGKSTTLKMLTGLLTPSAGRAEVLGFDVSRQPLEVKRRMGVVPEDLCLFERLTGSEFLHFAGRMHGLPLPEVSSRARELLAMMELDSQPGKLIVEYSHGMKKKLSLAAAMLHNPQILFLDEPFEGVDAVASRMLKDLLLEGASRGLTVFLTTHVLEIVERMCSDVAIIQRGKLVLAGSLAELRQTEGGPARTLEQVFLEALGEEGRSGRELPWLRVEGS